MPERVVKEAVLGEVETPAVKCTFGHLVKSQHFIYHPR